VLTENWKYLHAKFGKGLFSTLKCIPIACAYVIKYLQRWKGRAVYLLVSSISPVKLLNSNIVQSIAWCCFVVRYSWRGRTYYTHCMTCMCLNECFPHTGSFCQMPIDLFGAHGKLIENSGFRLHNTCPELYGMLYRSQERSRLNCWRAMCYISIHYACAEHKIILWWLFILPVRFEHSSIKIGTSRFVQNKKKNESSEKRLFCAINFWYNWVFRRFTQSRLLKGKFVFDQSFKYSLHWYYMICA